ncbi:MAG TPA: S8 family serine peptidase [Nocardioidaceae bacterium]|nr:S8 family serine peptidase [Nocardioidaceae bacterium]
MRLRPISVAALCCVLVVPAGMATAAPDGDAPDSDSRDSTAPSFHERGGQVVGPPGGDLDGDRISDDFEARLGKADAADRVRVIVTGLDSRQGRRAVGPFALKHELGLIHGFAATMTAAQARALARNPLVRRVEEDGVVHALDDATDRDFGAAAARDDLPGLDGSGVGICVIDTGVDPAHEQIAPRAVGFVDYVNGRTAAYDDHGHGTHVASIAAGDGGGGANAATFGGVAPAADLWAAKVLSSGGTGADSDVAAAVQWCHGQPGVDVLSLSLGSPGTDGKDAVSQAVDAAVAGGDVVVVAAGNSGDAPRTISAPGVAADAVTVGAVSDRSAPAGTARRDNGIWLAAFSSRGPTIAGLTKPDIAAPGVTVTAADAGTASGYVTYSGTSMATPYVSGAVALALEAAPDASPAEVKGALTGSALDVGPSGADNDWGAGLVDVRALVDAVMGQTMDRTAFPTWERRSGAVPTAGSVDLPVVVPDDALGSPLAMTLTVTSGRLNCDIFCQLGLSPGEWTPDLDVELRDPDGVVVAESQCALSGVSCATGRQETIGIVPQKAGTYTLRIYAWSGGEGGSFELDISRGPLSGGADDPGDEEPPANQSPTADAGEDLTVQLPKKATTAAFTLDGTGSSDPDGSVVGYAWTEPGTAWTSSAPQVTLSRPAGTYTFSLVVTDDDAATSQPDSVTVVVGGRGKPSRR